MIDQPLHVEDVIDMYNEKILILQKEIDRLNEEIQALNIQLNKQREMHEVQALHIELMQERVKNND
jgi:chaperonin GroEL (HSP60 family)